MKVFRLNLSRSQLKALSLHLQNIIQRQMAELMVFIPETIQQAYDIS